MGGGQWGLAQRSLGGMEHTLYRTPVNHKTHTHIRVRPNVLGFISAFYYLVFISLIICCIIQLDVSISYLENVNRPHHKAMMGGVK